MEQTILAQVHRLPSLPSSFVGLETVLGDDTNIEFGDYLAREFRLIFVFPSEFVLSGRV